MTVAVDTHIGQYRIVKTLGAGGMGTVYLGEHILLGRRAAIKTLLPALSSHRDIVDRFFNEARAISAISDPGVVQIFDFGYHVDGTAYIVMEYLEGESLATRLDRLAKLPLIEALRLTRQIAASLGAAHARGIIHRDLKPGNVFVIRDSEAQGGERTKILDFGIAKLVSKPTDVVATQTGTMLGTPVYMSPEQCRGDGRVDHRSDIYSAGCALFHMLTGVPPFDCDSVGDFIAAHLKEEPPRPSELAHELPQAVDDLLMCCLAKRREDRFQTMAELQRACEEILATLSDSGRGVQPVQVSATPLGEGFVSKYDVNRAEKSRTVGGRPSRSAKGANGWFVDSQSLDPAASAALDDDEHGWLPPERGMTPFQRIMLVLALFAGLVGGLIAVTYALGDDATAMSPDVTASVDPLGPAVATTNETMVAQPPPELVQADQLLEDLNTILDGEPPEAEAPAAATPAQTKPERPRPARTQNRPRPRRPVVAPPSAPEPPPEDLYDTR